MSAVDLYYVSCSHRGCAVAGLEACQRQLTLFRFLIFLLEMSYFMIELIWRLSEHKAWSEFSFLALFRFSFVHLNMC